VRSVTPETLSGCIALAGYGVIIAAILASAIFIEARTVKALRSIGGERAEIEQKMVEGFAQIEAGLSALESKRNGAGALADPIADVTPPLWSVKRG
jgi:hypothetical protein